METFAISYHTCYQTKTQFSTTITQGNSGKEQRCANWQTPRRAWTLIFEKDPIVLQQLTDFFEARKGAFEAFFWIDPKGVQRRVRFGSDELDTDVTWGGYGRARVLLIEVI